MEEAKYWKMGFYFSYETNFELTYIEVYSKAAISKIQTNLDNVHWPPLCFLKPKFMRELYALKLCSMPEILGATHLLHFGKRKISFLTPFSLKYE